MMNRRIGNDLRVVAVCCWVAAASFYWWDRVPPAPTHVIPLAGRSVRWTPAMGKVIALCGRKPAAMRPSGLGGKSLSGTVGPLEFYDAATGAATHQFFTPADEILAVSLRTRKVAIVLRNERIEAVSLENGKLLCELTDVDADSQFVFVDGGRIVICHHGHSATAFDLERGEVLWKRDPVALMNGGSDFGCEIISVRVADMSLPQCWNVRTGKQDPRFPGPRGPMAVSGEGNRFVMVEPGWCTVFDSALQKEVCRIPTIRQGTAAERVSLDETGRRLCLWHRGPESRQFHLWDCDTGKELDVSSGPMGEISAISTDLRWAMQAERILTLTEQLVKKLPTALGQRLQKSKWFWGVMVRATRSSSDWVLLNEVSTGASLGRFEVPNFAEWLMVVDLEQRAAAFGGTDCISCYSIPARRDWMWLVKWGLAPVLVLVGTVQLWRRRRVLESATSFGEAVAS